MFLISRAPKDVFKLSKTFRVFMSSVCLQAVHILHIERKCIYVLKISVHEWRANRQAGRYRKRGTGAPSVGLPDRQTKTGSKTEKKRDLMDVIIQLTHKPINAPTAGIAERQTGR